MRVVCLAVHDVVDIDRLFAVNDLVDTYIVTANDLTELSFCQHHIRMQRTGIRECPQQVYGVQNFIDEFLRRIRTGQTEIELRASLQLTHSRAQIVNLIL